MDRSTAATLDLEYEGNTLACLGSDFKGIWVPSLLV